MWLYIGKCIGHSIHADDESWSQACIWGLLDNLLTNNLTVKSQTGVLVE